MDSNQNNITFIERNNRAEDESTNLKSKLPKVNPYLAFFLNRRNQLMIFVWIFALTVPILCYFFLFHQQLPIITSIETCSVNSTFRVKCGNLNLTDSKARGNCVSLSCCFDDFTRECFHSLPSRYFYTKDKANLEQSPFLTALDRNVYVFYNEGSDHVNIRLSNDQNDAFNSNQKLKNLMYTIEKDSNKLEINVKRINSQKLLLTSSLGPLISTQNYMEITFYLGQHLFGLDQLYFNSNETYNKIIYHNGDDHTTIPGFIAYQEGKFHGFLIDYDGPLEISVLPSRLIILRAIGKRRINFTLHVGPTPEDIAKFFYKQNNYQVPEKWVLGPHICRSGSKNVEDAQQFYDEFQEKSAIYNLRYESDCFDENLYFMMINETLSETNLTLNEETKFIMTIFPHIPKLSTLFDISSENDLFYAKNETESQNGTYFDLDVYYPDYTHENIAVLINELKGQFDIVDGFSFSNNWGSDDSVIPIETSNEFVYTHENITKSFLNTLLYNATSNSIEHFYNHNLYGKNHQNSFDFPPNLILTTSSFAKTSILQVENLNGTWTNLKSSLSKTMLHGLLAYPLISIPICGSTKHFDLDSQIELCTRWYMMGAFMPILKINSEAPYRDPTSFDTDHHRNLVLNAFKFREKFFLYLYTILIKEEPIIRPMFYEFYSDLSTFHLDEQYMVGENLLLAQPFSPESSLMRVYLPQNETFYEYFGGMEYSGDRLGWVNLTYRPTDWFVFVRGGSILILLDEKVENEVKVEYFQVVVALKTGEGDESKKEAFGSVILDGIELSVKSTESEVTISKDGSQDCCINGLDYPKIIDSFIFYGLNESKVEFNSVNFDFCGDNCVYTLT